MVPLFGGQTTSQECNLLTAEIFLINPSGLSVQDSFQWLSHLFVNYLFRKLLFSNVKVGAGGGRMLSLVTSCVGKGLKWLRSGSPSEYSLVSLSPAILSWILKTVKQPTWPQGPERSSQVPSTRCWPVSLSAPTDSGLPCSTLNIGTQLSWCMESIHTCVRYMSFKMIFIKMKLARGRRQLDDTKGMFHISSPGRQSSRRGKWTEGYWNCKGLGRYDTSGVTLLFFKSGISTTV